ncbi:MAG: UvrD-helicase domain-containing protein [Acidobacteria bacterium]|jgi:ATP-dependent exoDNAse (exonuclease V) beta subunit|nr:UvrD-helicase domain-containing protein [Acidobacteriota bacterium]
MGFVLYRSSAGSGKTYTLVKEYLKLILENPGKFKHILAITFTNKAAGEMKDRIMQSLKKLAKGEDKALEKVLLQEMPHLQNIGKISSNILTSLLHNYSDFAIMTIDSFIHKVIKAFALEIGLPLNFGIDLNYEKIETYVIERLMANVGKDEYITDIILKFVFSRIQEDRSWNIEEDIRKFEKELFNEKNNEWLQNIGDFDNIMFYRFMEQLEMVRDDYVKRLNHLGNQAMALIREKGLKIDDFAYKKSGAAGVLQKCMELRAGKIKDFDVGSRFRNFQWLANSTPKDIKVVIENILANGLERIAKEIIDHHDSNRSLVLTAVSILDNIYLAAIINELKSLIDEYKRRNNVIPISEFNTRVYEIVKNSPIPFIYSILGEKYNHYLIDEFQDTSRLQWENLYPLIDNALGSDFFSMAVGDGKQSIYRWRGGDVEIMENDIKNRIMPEQLSINPLDKNFRSLQNIVAFNNSFFQKISEFYAAAQGEGPGKNLLGKVYSGIIQQPVREQGGYVSVQFIENKIAENDGEPPDDDTHDEPDVQVFEHISYIVNNSLAAGFRYNDIAVLVRENRHGQKVAEYLLENHIPVVSPDSLILSRIPLVRFFINILVYLGNPADKIAESSIIYFLVLNKLQNESGHLTHPDATAAGDYFAGGNPWDIMPETREFSQRREYLIRMPVYEVIEEVIRVFKLPEILDFKSMGYLQAFLDIVAGYSVENSLDFSSFLDWWEFNKEEYTVMVPETKPAVKIMSIHKAKGLEFPVVIIPYVNWEHKIDPQLWLHADPPVPVTPPLNFPMPVDATKKLEETFFIKAYLDEQEKVLIDNINLLYVAFTRAVDALYIIAPQRKRKNDNYDRLREAAVHIMAEDMERRGHFFFGEPIVRVAEEEKPQEIEFVETEGLISNEWHSRITIRRKSKEFWRFDTGYRSERRNWGLLVHQVLAHINEPADISRAVSAVLISGDIDIEERKILEQKIQEIFEIEEVKEWFNPIHKEIGAVFAESPIITSQGILRPDRVLVSGDKVKIIDFKTGAKESAHVEQMKKYREAVRAMGYENIDTYLFYLENKIIEKVY